MRNILPLLPLALTLILAACNGGGSTETPGQMFVNDLNNVDANYVYQLVKENTYRGGAWLVVSQSQFYVSCTDPGNTNTCQNIPYKTFNYAVDLNDPTRGSYGNSANFFNGTSLGVGFDPGSGYFFDMYGNWYEKQGSVIKDLNVLGAKAEQVKQAIYATEIQNRYGLSNERSFALAKMGLDMQYLAKKNGGTLAAKDSEAFEKFAFGGVKVKSMMEHMQTGDSAALQKDKEAIARANGISVDDVAYLLMKSKSSK